MWKFFLLSISILQLSQAFDVDGWVKKFCVKDKEMMFYEENFYCENASFTRQELDDIQHGGFVISNDKTIMFKGGDIGVLNENFLKKFPHSENLKFQEVKIKLDQSSGTINHPFNSINFRECEFSGIKDSLFFQQLQNLKHLGINDNKFDTSVLDKNLFGHNSNLLSLHLRNNSFEKIDDNAFEGLSNIETFTLSASLDHISPHLLSGMKKLNYLDLTGNKFVQVPCDAIPESVEELSLTENELRKPSFVGCKSLKNLKNLYLGENNIEDLDESAFEALENLEHIALDHNKLKGLSNELFKNLKNLKRIYLVGNGIEKTDIRSDIIVDLVFDDS